ncbi:hypothetical protein [Paremcibacter congregatus]|uniref:hypothetical protein n=1 Tax=Paremcibacter congregatus TaxID=2043170 RepID=UPI003A93FDA7
MSGDICEPAPLRLKIGSRSDPMADFYVMSLPVRRASNVIINGAQMRHAATIRWKTRFKYAVVLVPIEMRGA